MSGSLTTWAIKKIRKGKRQAGDRKTPAKRLPYSVAELFWPLSSKFRSLNPWGDNSCCGRSSRRVLSSLGTDEGGNKQQQERKDFSGIVRFLKKEEERIETMAAAVPGHGWGNGAPWESRQTKDRSLLYFFTVPGGILERDCQKRSRDQPKLVLHCKIRTDVTGITYHLFKGILQINEENRNVYPAVHMARQNCCWMLMFGE